MYKATVLLYVAGFGYRFSSASSFWITNFAGDMQRTNAIRYFRTICCCRLGELWENDGGKWDCSIESVNVGCQNTSINLEICVIKYSNWHLIIIWNKKHCLSIHMIIYIGGLNLHRLKSISTDPHPHPLVLTAHLHQEIYINIHKKINR